jgi:hypothetical protein
MLKRLSDNLGKDLNAVCHPLHQVLHIVQQRIEVFTAFCK